MKTRLAADLGESLALELYEAFLSDVLLAASGCPASLRVHLTEPLEGSESSRLLATLEALPRELQVPGDLGTRMAAAFALEARAGARRVALVGSDLPLLATAELEACLSLAGPGAEGPVVLAPTEDGGFWCVAGWAGLPWSSIFAEIAWSSGSERAQCQARLEKLGLPVVLGPAGLDVDELEDLRRVARQLESAPPGLAPETRGLLSRRPEITG